MSPESFCYWLQGALEICAAKEFNATQLQIIQDHLDLVFNKVTPKREVEVAIDVPRLRPDWAEVFKPRFDGIPLPSGPFPSAPIITC